MLITLLIAVIILALALYAVSMIPLDPTPKMLLQVAIVIIALVFIARTAGLA